MRYNLKLGATISLDMEKEKDIVEIVEDLKSRHKLGDYISNLLRFAIDNPDALKAAGIEAEGYMVSKAREKFFSEVSEEVADMVQRVNVVYNEAMRVSTLAKMNKHLGIKEKAESVLMAQFILQRQINTMCQALGLDTMVNDYTSNKVAKVDQLSADVLEYIIESYDGIVNELSNSVQAVNIAVKDNVITESNYDKNIIQNTLMQESNVAEAIVEEPAIVISKESLINDDEVIDFGAADLGALSAFCG